MTGRGPHDLGVRAAGDRRDRALGRIEGVVRVGVDQPGKQRLPATVDDDGRRSVVGGVGRQRRAVGDDRRDPLAIDDDVDVLAGGVGHAVDEPDRLEDRPHRAMLPTGAGRRAARLGAMSDGGLQRRYAPESRCFGCGPANPEGLRIESHEAATSPTTGRRRRAARRLAAAPPPRGVRQRPQRRDHRDAARLPRELDRGDAADARTRPRRAARLRDRRLRDPPAPSDAGRSAGPAARLARLESMATGSSSTPNWHPVASSPPHAAARSSPSVPTTRRIERW